MIRHARLGGWLSVLLLAAAGLTSPSPAVAQPRPSGELTVALSSLATETLDPVLGGHIVKFYLSQIFDYLVGVTPDGKLSKDTGVASRWDVSGDHTRWTFYLRKGIKFHNGDELTSDDVKWSIQRALGKRSTTGYAGPLRALVADIETPAPDRVVIVTKEPTLIVPSYLSRALSTEGMILPRKYIESKGDDYFATHPVGSGPYRFVERVSGSHLRLEAVDSHWRAGTPRYKTLVFRLVPEETTRVAMLRQGKADIIDLSRDRMKEVKADGFPIHLRRDDAHIDYWWVEPWDKAPVKDRRVREALNIAIDRKELADTVFGGLAEPGPIPYGLTWSFPDVGFKVTPELGYAYDPARAKKLLADAGYPRGFSMEMFAYRLPGLPEGRAMAEAVAGYWEKIGVETKLIPVDYAAFRKKWFDRSAPGALGYYNMANRNWIGTYALIEKYGYSKEKSAAMHDPELDSMITAVTHQTDQAKVDALMRSIFTRLRTESLGVPLVSVHTPYASGKQIVSWNPGSIMYDLNLDELLTSK